MASTVANTHSSIAFRGHQRAMDRCSNGNLVALVPTSATAMALYCSVDNGATWSTAGLSLSDCTSASVFVEGSTDDVYVAFKADTTDYIYCTRATANSARTSWTLLSNTFVHDNAYDHPTVVAFPDPGVPGGYIAAVAVQYATGAECRIVKWSAAGTPSLGQTLLLMSAGSSSATIHPSIDFHHTGDGKTIQGTAPHLYSVVASPDTGVTFRKHTYSGGTWTAGSSVVLDSTVPTSGRLSAVFDGSRMCALWSNGSTLEFAERDAADTTTTARTPTALSDGTILGVSLSVDVAGDLWAAAIGDTSDDVSTSKFSRGALTWGSWTATEAITAFADSVSLRRCGTGPKIGVVYGSDTGTDVMRFAEVGTANTAPLAPTWVNVSGAADVAVDLTLDWGFNDDQVVYGDEQSAYAVKRVLSGVTRWWNGTDWTATSETWITSTTSSLTLSSGWASASDAARDYYAATKDTAGLAGPYSDALNVVPSAKVNPTLTVDTTEETAARTTAWTVAEQSAYRSRLLSGTTVLSDSGWVANGSARSYLHAYALSNGTSVTEEITTKNTEGLASNAVTQSFSVAYTPPFQPGLTITSATGFIRISVSNPTPTGSRPQVSHNNLYRRVGDDDLTAILIARVAVNETYDDYTVASGVDYQYRVEAVGVNGTVSGAAEAESGGGGGGTTGWTPGGGYALSFI